MQFLSPMCFICLNSKNNLEFISTEMLTKLLYCIEKTEEFIPSTCNQRKICNDCLDKLSAAFHFKKMCLDNIVQFKNYIDQLDNNSESCNVIKVDLFDLKHQDMTKYVNIRLESKESIDLSIGQYSNKQSETVFIKEEIADEVVQKNLEIIEESTNKKIFIKSELQLQSCEENQHYLNNEFNTLLHKEETLDEELKNQGPSKKVKNEIFLTCPICKAYFTLKENLIQHMQFHSRDKHPSKQLYGCDKCRECFTTKYALRKHVLIHMENKPYTCATCGKGFIQNYLLKRHVLIHSDRQSFACPTCKRRFLKQNYLDRHITTVHNKQGPHSCLVCGKYFTYRSDLKRHVSVHTNERLYSCPQCLKSFSRNHTLKQHMLIHSNEQLYSCNMCKKKI